MQDSMRPARRTRSPRACGLAVATLSADACWQHAGEAHHRPRPRPADEHLGVVHTGGPEAPRPPRVERPSRRRRDELGLDHISRRRIGTARFRQCMRANGVPTFPDPNPGRRLPTRVVESIPRRPRSRRRRRSARSSCRAAASLPPDQRRTRPHRRWRSCSRSRDACASTASPVPRPWDLSPGEPVRLRHPGDNRLRRCDPPVPVHAQHALARVRSGHGRVRRPRRKARPRPALITRR